MNSDSVPLRPRITPAKPAPAPGFVHVSRSNGSGPPVSLPIVDIREWKSFIRILNEEMRPLNMKSATAVVSFDGAVVLERFWSRYLFSGAGFEVAWKDNPVSRPHSWREKWRGENSTQASETESRDVLTPWETDMEEAESPMSYSPDPGPQALFDSPQTTARPVLYRKPVITFYPLQDNVRITATLTLDPSLSFSYIHPLPAGITISRLSKNRSITWDIDADRGGGLKLHPSGEAASYLFWEALSGGRGFDGAAGTGLIIVSVDAFPDFVTGFMKRLGFGVKECQDMVTYWGPQLVGTAVAMRFVEPETYNALARLDIAAAEEARVVRLFALLCVMDGVHMTAEIEEETIEEMVVLLLGGREKPEVGKEFCVFEWGGMIVNSL